MKLTRMLVVLSACTGGPLDEYNTGALAIELENLGLAYDDATGWYNGVTEASFIVQCSDFVDVGKLVNLAAGYAQESVLLVDARNKAFLIYCSGSRMEALGYLMHKDISNVGAVLPTVAYTQVGTGVYYTL